MYSHLYNFSHFGSIVDKIKKNKATNILLEDYIKFIEDLNSYVNQGKWSQFSVGHERWQSLSQFIENQIPTSGQIHDRLLESYSLSKILTNKIILRKTAGVLGEEHPLVVAMKRLKSGSTEEECTDHKKKFKSDSAMREHLKSFHPEVYVGSAAHDEPGPSDIGLPVLDIPEIMDTEDTEIPSSVMEADFSCIEEDSSEDDDQPEIQQIILSSDEEEEDFEETTAPEASSFFEGLPNLLSENELRLFHGFAKNIIKCRVNGTRICDIAQITEATYSHNLDRCFFIVSVSLIIIICIFLQLNRRLKKIWLIFTCYKSSFVLPDECLTFSIVYI
nr:uncharacterized protein LOC124493753 [Dermatophagoides farinae]